MSEQESLVSLESYATVIAGLSAGLDLPRSLAHADVPPSEWGSAERQWRSRIDESAASDLTLLVAFDAALLAAKRRFEPVVEPIESDAAAWASFRRHFLTAVDPVAFLGQHELPLATYARIEADWANRTATDEALAAALQRHLAGPLEDCPVLKRIPPPVLAGRDASLARAPEVRLLPDLPAMPDQPAEPLGPRPVLELALPPAPLPEGPVARPAPPQVLPPAMLHVHARADETLMGSLVPEGPSLPFDKPAPAAPAKPPAPWIPPAVRGLTTADETLMAPLVPDGPALPFEEPASVEEPTPKPRDAHIDEGVGETVFLFNVPSTRTLPFKEEVGDTVLVFQLPSTPALPFKDTGKAAGATPSKAAEPRPPSMATEQRPAPRAPEPSGPTPWLSLEHYAALCVELALYPAHHVEVLHRYSIDEARRRELDAYWSPRVQADVSLRAAWDGYYVAHWKRLRDGQKGR